MNWLKKLPDWLVTILLFLLVQLGASVWWASEVTYEIRGFRNVHEQAFANLKEQITLRTALRFTSGDWQREKATIKAQFASTREFTELQTNILQQQVNAMDRRLIFLEDADRKRRRLPAAPRPPKSP